jgi:3-oxoacyl-[acyl-carrier-protein] synthase II
LGLVSPLGCGIEPVWKRLLSGESGLKIEHFDVSDLASQVAGIIPRKSMAGAAARMSASFDPDATMPAA